MDLSSPISSVIPSAHGRVLAVLARTTEPLSGRRVTALTNGTASQNRVNEILGALADAGIVLREHRPPAKLYRLNRDHVAAAGVTALVQQWDALLQRMRDEIADWAEPPLAACLFGSAARGEADVDSDMDVLLVPGARVATSEEAERIWHFQLDQFAERVRLWSGNTCEVLELTVAELADGLERDDLLVRDLRRDAISLAGRDVRELLRRRVAS
jgi:predicted nucleotidyltransferase